MNFLLFAFSLMLLSVLKQMIPISRSRSLSVLLVFFVLEGSLWAEARPGLIPKVQGRVTVRLLSEEKATPVKAGDPVLVGHLVQTEKESKAQIVLKDDSLITILPESELRINQYSYSSREKRARVIIQVFHGKRKLSIRLDD